jgi:hypothetical protein
MGKGKQHKITSEQIHKMERKVSREENFDDGWVATHRVHKSAKAYSRKNKRNERY